MLKSSSQMAGNDDDASFLVNLFEENFRSHKIKDQEIRIWKNGEAYIGGVEDNGYFKGKGIYCFPTGEYFEGFFFQNKAEGFGTLNFPDGSFIIGEFKKGFLSGRALFYSTKLSTWRVEKYSDGKFENSIENGQGRPSIKKCQELQENKNFIDSQDLSLTQQINQSPIDQITIGILEIKNNTRFFGLIKNGNPAGLGIQIGSNMIEIGQFNLDGLHEFGIRHVNQEFIYKGPFKENLPHGDGILLLGAEMSIIRGNFDNGNLNEPYKVKKIDEQIISFILVKNLFSCPLQDKIQNMYKMMNPLSSEDKIDENFNDFSSKIKEFIQNCSNSTLNFSKDMSESKFSNFYSESQEYNANRSSEIKIKKSQEIQLSEKPDKKAINEDKNSQVVIYEFTLPIQLKGPHFIISSDSKLLKFLNDDTEEESSKPTRTFGSYDTRLSTKETNDPREELNDYFKNNEEFNPNHNDIYVKVGSYENIEMSLDESKKKKYRNASSKAINENIQDQQKSPKKKFQNSDSNTKNMGLGLSGIKTDKSRSNTDDISINVTPFKKSGNTPTKSPKKSINQSDENRIMSAKSSYYSNPNTSKLNQNSIKDLSSLEQTKKSNSLFKDFDEEIFDTVSNLLKTYPKSDFENLEYIENLIDSNRKNSDLNSKIQKKINLSPSKIDFKAENPNKNSPNFKKVSSKSPNGNKDMLSPSKLSNKSPNKNLQESNQKKDSRPKLIQSVQEGSDMPFTPNIKVKKVYSVTNIPEEDDTQNMQSTDIYSPNKELTNFKLTPQTNNDSSTTNSNNFSLKYSPSSVKKSSSADRYSNLNSNGKSNKKFIKPFLTFDDDKITTKSSLSKEDENNQQTKQNRSKSNEKITPRKPSYKYILEFPQDKTSTKSTSKLNYQTESEKKIEHLKNPEKKKSQQNKLKKYKLKKADPVQNKLDLETNENPTKYSSPYAKIKGSIKNRIDNHSTNKLMSDLDQSNFEPWKKRINYHNFGIYPVKKTCDPKVDEYYFDTLNIDAHQRRFLDSTYDPFSLGTKRRDSDSIHAEDPVRKSTVQNSKFKPIDTNKKLLEEVTEEQSEYQHSPENRRRKSSLKKIVISLSDSEDNNSKTVSSDHKKIQTNLDSNKDCSRMADNLTPKKLVLSKFLAERKPSFSSISEIRSQNLSQRSDNNSLPPEKKIYIPSKKFKKLSPSPLKPQKENKEPKSLTRLEYMNPIQEPDSPIDKDSFNLDQFTFKENKPSFTQVTIQNIDDDCLDEISIDSK